MRRMMLLLVTSACMLGAAVVPAGATFKGENGLLAYQAQAGARVQLFTAHPDGSGVRQLTHFADSDATNAAWSPDGSKLAFIRQWGPNKARLYTMNADGTGFRQLDRKLRLVVAWLPDGTHLLVIRSLRFAIVNTDGSKARDAGIPGLGDSPCVLADGSHVALLVSRNDRERAIFIGRLGGGPGSLKRITAWEPIADKIDCSPDGTRVAFSTPEFGPPRSSNVYSVRIDGGDLRQLTHATGGTVNNGLDSWSPDGKRIAFVSNRAGRYQIYAMDADGSHVTQLTRSGEAHLAAWGAHP